MDEEKIDYFNIEQDIVKEVGNIISNNCANAFSSMIKENVNINTDIKFISIEDFKMEFILTKDFSEVFEGVVEKIFNGFFIKTSTGAEGISVILFKQDHVNQIIESLYKNISPGNEINQEQKDAALKEFSQITMHSYLTTLSKMINTEISYTEPIPANDLLGVLYDFKENLLKENQNRALMLRTTINAEGTGIKGKLIILLEPNSIEKIIVYLKRQSMGLC
jgi:chemotaxis protein CheY-P-specific phosphatase CheC